MKHGRYPGAGTFQSLDADVEELYTICQQLYKDIGVEYPVVKECLQEMFVTKKHTHTYTYIYTYIYTHIHTHTHIHTYTHTHIHTYTHTHTYISKRSTLTQKYIYIKILSTIQGFDLVQVKCTTQLHLLVELLLRWL